MRDLLADAITSNLREILTKNPGQATHSHFPFESACSSTPPICDSIGPARTGRNFSLGKSAFFSIVSPPDPVGAYREPAILLDGGSLRSGATEPCVRVL